MAIPKIKKTSLSQVLQLVNQLSPNEKNKLESKLSDTKSKRVDADKDRQKWLTEWKQELGAIKKNGAQWQKELSDRKFLNKLS